MDSPVVGQMNILRVTIRVTAVVLSWVWDETDRLMDRILYWATYRPPVVGSHVSRSEMRKAASRADAECKKREAPTPAQLAQRVRRVG